MIFTLFKMGGEIAKNMRYLGKVWTNIYLNQRKFYLAHW